MITFLLLLIVAVLVVVVHRVAPDFFADLWDRLKTVIKWGVLAASVALVVLGMPRYEELRQGEMMVVGAAALIVFAFALHAIGTAFERLTHISVAKALERLLLAFVIAGSGLILAGLVVERV